MVKHSRSLDVVILLGLCFLCFFFRLWSTGLYDLDEGLYAETAREMVLTGDYITPRVNHRAFFDKPPFVFWCSALAYRLFGFNEFAARFPSALTSTLLVLLVYWIGSIWFGRRAGLLAGIMLALNVMVVSAAHQMTMDAQLDFWIAASILCFFLARQSEKNSFWWYHLAWASAGIGILTKSLIGIVFPGLTIIAYCVSFVMAKQREAGRKWTIGGVLAPAWQEIKKVHFISGILVMLLVAGPWHYLDYRANGFIFIREFFIHQQLERFEAKDFSHNLPYGTYVLFFLIGFFPWSTFFPASLTVRSGREERSDTTELRRLLICWFFTIFIFFSLSRSELISYLLPGYAAAALLVGDWWSRRIEDGLGMKALRWSFGVILVTAVVAVVIVVGWVRPDVLKKGLMPDPVLRKFILALLVWAIGGLIATVLIWINQRRAAFAALAGMMIIFIGVAVTLGLSTYENTVLRPLHSLAREVSRIAPPDAGIAWFGLGSYRKPSIFFYLPNRLFKTGGPGVYEPHTLAEMEQEIKDGQVQYIITTAKGADHLLPAPGLKILNQHRNQWYLIEANRPAVMPASKKSPSPGPNRPIAPAKT